MATSISQKYENEFPKQEASGKYVCSICGYVYDPVEHDGIAFEDLPDDWRCPRCKQSKEKSNKVWTIASNKSHFLLRETNE